MTNPNNPPNTAEVQRGVFDTDECLICLGFHVNKSQPPCGHVFCYQCLANWCQIKLTCPICKRPFTSFIHTIRSPNEYQVYTPDNPDSEHSDEDLDFYYDLNNIYRLGESLDEDDVRLAEELQDLLINLYDDLNTVMRSINSTDDEPSAAVREAIIYVNNFGAFFRNNREARRRLEIWRNTAPDRPIISAFFSQALLTNMENRRPGMSHVLCQLFSHLAGQ